jgi:hypothetical protein
MSYINNGYERTLDINIIAYINGINNGGVVESGLGSFSYSGNTYPAISINDMQDISESDYENRMNDFCDYLQVKYNGLIIQNRAVNGNATDNLPRRLNSGGCPIVIAQHNISLSASLIYLYGITPDTQNITMSSTDSWQVNGLPSIVSVTPTSGDNTVTQLQCIRTNWGNDTLVIQNLYNNQIVSCTIQALYLSIDKNSASLSDTNNTVQIGISIAGGLDDYNIIKTGDTGYFTVTKGTFTPGNTITVTSITVTSITSSQNRSLTITLQHVTNPLVQQIITVIYIPQYPIYVNLSSTLVPNCEFCFHGNQYTSNIYTNEGYVHPGSSLYYDSAHTIPVQNMALVTDLVSYNGIMYAYNLSPEGLVLSSNVSWLVGDSCPFTC